MDGALQMGCKDSDRSGRPGEEEADASEAYDRARDGMLADLRRGYDLGTQGEVAATRDSLHER
jgi:hypothetical protein